MAEEVVVADAARGCFPVPKAGRAPEVPHHSAREGFEDDRNKRKRDHDEL